MQANNDDTREAHSVLVLWSLHEVGEAQVNVQHTHHKCLVSKSHPMLIARVEWLNHSNDGNLENNCQHHYNVLENQVVRVNNDVR